MITDDLRQVTPEEVSHMPDYIRVYVVCKSDFAIDTTYFNGWYFKIGNHLQNSDKGFISIDNKNFDFYVKFQYSLPVAQQIIFDVATELHGGFEGLSAEELSNKLYDVVKEIDNMNLWR